MLDLKSLARFCCDFLNLQRLAESVFSRFDRQMRHKRDKCFTQRSEIADSVICRIGRNADSKVEASANDGSAGIRNAASAAGRWNRSPVFHLFFTGQSVRLSRRKWLRLPGIRRAEKSPGPTAAGRCWDPGRKDRRRMRYRCAATTNDTPSPFASGRRWLP